MTADPLEFFWQHDVEVARFTGAGPVGDTYADPTTETGFVDDGQKLVTGLNGEQVTSTARIYLPVATAAVPLRSHVTLPDVFGGVTREVVAVARCVLEEGLPQHIEIALQ